MLYAGERSGNLTSVLLLALPHVANCGRASVSGTSGRLYAVHVGREWDGMIVTEPFQRQPKTVNMKVEYIWTPTKYLDFVEWGSFGIFTMIERTNRGRSLPFLEPYSGNISPMAV